MIILICGIALGSICIGCICWHFLYMYRIAIATEKETNILQIVGKEGARWSTLLNVPYCFIPLMGAVKFLGERPKQPITAEKVRTHFSGLLCLGRSQLCYSKYDVYMVAQCQFISYLGSSGTHFYLEKTY